MPIRRSEAYERARGAIEPALELRAEINSHPLISKHFRVLVDENAPGKLRDELLVEYLRPGMNWAAAVQALKRDEAAFDVTRLTLACGAAGYDVAHFTELLASNCEYQIRNTLRDGVLLEIKINNSRREIARLISGLLAISHALENHLEERASKERAAFYEQLKLPMKETPAMETRAMSTSAA